MAVVLVVGGKSEDIYFRTILQKGHPWADLTTFGASVANAEGDSKIPSLVNKILKNGDKPAVLYDSDALERAGEQTAVIQNEEAVTFHLNADFEGAFDPSILRRALASIGYESEVACLQNAVRSRPPFEHIQNCVRATPGARPLDKSSLASALSLVSERWWYVPEEFSPIFARLDTLCSVDGTRSPHGIIAKESLPGARGHLFLGNHVSNEQVVYWDFDQQRLITLPLPGRFDGRLTLCRRGTRIVTQRYLRGSRGDVETTWIYVFDINGASLTEASRFQLQGSAYEVLPDEDGNHIQLCVDRAGKKLGMRCLTNGTQRELLPALPSIGLNSAQYSRSGRLTAAGPTPLTVLRQGIEVIAFPHFYAHSFTWSPDERYLAFFARRWRAQPPDFLWIYDMRSDQIHRVASGESMMPVYWA